jgi:hypothetical protein
VYKLEVDEDEDGVRSETEYVDGKRNGRWTVYYPNGKKNFERQYVNDVQNGYQRDWDENGNLIEEQWYRCGELHGVWKRWDSAGALVDESEFYCGIDKNAFDTSLNSEFERSIRPILEIEPADCGGRIQEILSGFQRKTATLAELPTKKCDLQIQGSFFNYVNVLGTNESWPVYEGEPLYPILQLRCQDIAMEDNPLAEYSYITVFAANDCVFNLGEDIVLRMYRRDDPLVSVQRPPCKPLAKPRSIVINSPLASFPCRNDLPPGLKVWMEDDERRWELIKCDGKLNTRIGGWPGWIQSGQIYYLGQFLFQLDSLDVNGWECGGSTVHYFFLNDDGSITYLNEMC